MMRKVIETDGASHRPRGAHHTARDTRGAVIRPPWNYPHLMSDLAEPAADPGLAPSILLVEDEPGIVDFLTRGLRAEGFLVEAALDGVEGERRALAESFDMVVLDL